MLCYAEELTHASAITGYDESFVDLVEIVYGEGFLSQGSHQSVDYMLAGLDLRGKKILDIGCGLGAPTLHIAQQHAVAIIGIDPNPTMIQKAQKHLEEMEPFLLGQAQFLVMEHPSHLKEFENESFDLIFSKEALLHIPLEHKPKFFQEIARVLKKGGEIVILDWMHSSPHYSDQTKKMMEMDGIAYHLMTPADYQKMLEEVGFIDITGEDRSAVYAQYAQEDIQRIQENSFLIQKQYGLEHYEYCLESWGLQKDAFLAKELMPTLFKAKKISF